MPPIGKANASKDEITTRREGNNVREMSRQSGGLPVRLPPIGKANAPQMRLPPGGKTNASRKCLHQV